MRTTPSLPAHRVTIVSWPDQLIDTVGHDPRSRYVETFWLSVLGPSTTWLLRHLVDELEANPYGFELDYELTAKRLGLNAGSRHSPFMRALGRLVQFEMADPHPNDMLAIRRRVPPLSRRHLARLPESLRSQHLHWQSEQLHQPA